MKLHPAQVKLEGGQISPLPESITFHTQTFHYCDGRIIGCLNCFWLMTAMDYTNSRSQISEEHVGIPTARIHHCFDPPEGLGPSNGANIEMLASCLCVTDHTRVHKTFYQRQYALPSIPTDHGRRRPGSLQNGQKIKSDEILAIISQVFATLPTVIMILQRQHVSRTCIAKVCVMMQPLFSG